MNRFVSLSVLLVLILLLGNMLVQVVSPFILPLFLAAVLAVICQPLNNYFLRKTGQRMSVAAALSTVTLLAMLVIPTVIGTFVCALQLYSLAQQHLDGDWHRGLDLLWNRGALPAIEKIKQIYPGGLSDEQLASFKEQVGDNIQSLAGLIARRTFQIASSTVGIFVSLSVAAGMFITALYYFLADGPAIISAAEEMIPLPIDHQRRLCQRFATVVRAVVTATFLAAFVQGFATAIAIQFCGLGYFWIFLAIATLASLIPLVGAWIVWVPCAAWLALQGHWTAAVLLTLWGAAVVSMLDNGVKMYVLQSDAGLHPLLAFISVVGALQLLGLWGIFIGPIVASCLFAIIRIFNEELKELVQERQGNSVDSLGSDKPSEIVSQPLASVPPAEVAARPSASAPKTVPSTTTKILKQKRRR
jgi:predicted PurR-regulated permease PerM